MSKKSEASFFGSLRTFLTKERKGFLLSPRFVKLSIREQSLFAKRLSFLANAGVPLLEGLHMLEDQATSSSAKAVIRALAKDIAQGQYLHTSMRKMPRAFSPFSVNIIRIGELTGILASNLAYLSEELRKREQLRKKIIGALVYPAFITISTLGVTALLTAYIFPKIMPIFSSLRIELPLTTLILIAVSSYLREWGIVTVIGLVIFGFIFSLLYNKVIPFRLVMERIILKLPIAGKMVQTYNTANFCRTLGILLKSGASFAEAIVITGDTLDNRTYRNQCMVIAENVKKGEQISKHLHRRKDLFYPLAAHMIAVGEKTGKLSETLLYLSQLYEEDLDDQSKNLSSSIEPILMVFMGLIVGFVAVSVITPIYSITQNLSR